MMATHHPMLSPTHYCKDCGALWRQHDDFSMTLRSEDCCDACNNTPVGGQLLVLAVPNYIAFGKLRLLVAAANRLSGEAEEYDTPDGMGRFALQSYWDEFESALERARESLGGA